MNKGRTIVEVLLIIVVLLIVLPVGCGLLIAGRGCGYMNRAANVVMQELDPAALLQKYEWFKDAAAQLNKKLADIQVYQGRLKVYSDMKRSEMDRADKEQLTVWQTELSGVIASYNGLAAEYNSQMAKINWRFSNIGQLPKGATEPLPREFASYKTSVD